MIQNEPIICPHIWDVSKSFEIFWSQNFVHVKQSHILLHHHQEHYKPKIKYLNIRGHSTTTWTEFCHSLNAPPPPFVDSFYILSVDKNRHFLTPSPPDLVHVVIECPLTKLDMKWNMKWNIFKKIGWLFGRHLAHSICSSFKLLADESRDLSQAEKKPTDQIHKMTIIFTQKC